MMDIRRRLMMLPTLDKSTLFSYGNENIALTGGWIGGEGGTLGNTHQSGVLAEPTTKITNSDHIGFANTNTTTKYRSVKFIRTKNKVDLTGFSKCIASIKYPTADSASSGLATYHGFGFKSDDDFDTNFKPKFWTLNYNTASSNIVTVELDISDAVGLHYALLASQHIRGKTQNSYLYLYEMILIK